MNRQALRSVYFQTRPEVYKTGQAVKNYFCQFSTAQSLAAENDGSSQPSNPSPKPSAGRPTTRQRTRAAANEISSLVRGRGRGGSAGPNMAQPLEGASTGPKVIDVRSLPRGGLARGRGGFRGRGTFTGASRRDGNINTSSSPNSGNRFSQPNRGSFAPGGRGGRGAQGARGARGGAQRGAGGRGRGRGRGGKGPKKEESHEERKARRQDPFERMDAAEKEFDDAMTFGTRTTYAPSLSLESLSQHVPAITSTPQGRSATVLQNLSTLGSADPVASPQGLQASSLAEDLDRDGIRFFADIKSLEAVEEYLQKKREVEATDGDGTDASQNNSHIISAAEESVKKVIKEQAIEGKHEAPKFATDPVGVARSWHLRAETYTQRDTDKFEKKLSSLIGGSKKGGGKTQAKA